MNTEDKFFMCFVDGRRAPKKKHPTRELAAEECMRLVDLNMDKDVYMLEVVHTIKAIQPAVLETVDKIAAIPEVESISVNGKSLTVQVTIKKKRVAVKGALHES